MLITPPALDDRDFDDLVDELLRRIPAHTPEWTDPRQGDPGRTLLELFAWLTDTLLYRVNLIPERQRLAFLNLLGEQMRPAVPARGLVRLAIDDDEATEAVTIKPFARIDGPVSFETQVETTVLPVTAEAYYKRPITLEDPGLINGLRTLYNVSGTAKTYATTAVFADGRPVEEGFDIWQNTADKSLWLALLAADETLKEQVRQSLGATASGGRQRIHIGIMPAISVPELFEEIGTRAKIAHVWEISRVTDSGEVEYNVLDLLADTTNGLTRPGVQQLALPAARFIGAPDNDVRNNLKAGVGDTPPRLDDEDKAGRLVAWLRLRPNVRLQSLPISWVGINAAEIDQRQTMRSQVIGQSDGTADQVMTLPARNVERATFQLQVVESGKGYQTWFQIDDLALAGRDDAVYELDSKNGTITFGNGVRGRKPETGARARVVQMRAGGGQAGNLPPGMLKAVSNAFQVGGAVENRLIAIQELATTGGEDAETLAVAEQRIPARLRHRDRAVTADDYRQLAAETPGIRLGRVEVLPRFKPQQRRTGVPGVVSILGLPHQGSQLPPNPRPDRPMLETLYAYLEARRPLGTEMYVIGCEYVPLGLSVAVTIANGFGSEEVLHQVRQALRQALWPLTPGGPQRQGWPLGRTVRDRELEVIVARVQGVNTVSDVKLFESPDKKSWRLISTTPNKPAELALDLWQLPELLEVVVVTGEEAPSTLQGQPNPFADEDAVAVPVVLEVCS